MSISTEEKDRYLRETAIVLAREGFQTGKTDTGKLRVLLDGAPLCEVTENGGITYRNEDIIRRFFHLIWECSRRLANVIVENKDFEDVIRQYDRGDAWIYCDPPYFEAECYEVSGI